MSIGYLNKIKFCNRYSEDGKIPFLIEGRRVGQVVEAHIDVLLNSGVFAYKNGVIIFKDSIKSFKDRNLALERVANYMVEIGKIKSLKDELYSISPTLRGEPMALVDRALSVTLGIISYGQHINGLVKTKDGLKMWIGKRAKDKGFEDGKLDQIAAGGLPWGISLEDNLAKECAEEASISKYLSSKAKSVGSVSYCFEYKEGGNRDFVFCYDLFLPQDFVPKNSDGEVESFELMDIEEVATIVRDTDRFKLNCNLVIIDFLIRYGYIKSSDRYYLDIVNGLKGSINCNCPKYDDNEVKQGFNS